MSPQNGTALTLVYMCTVLQLCFCQFLSKNKSTLRLMVKEPVNVPVVAHPVVFRGRVHRPQGLLEESSVSVPAGQGIEYFDLNIFHK